MPVRVPHRALVAEQRRIALRVEQICGLFSQPPPVRSVSTVLVVRNEAPVHGRPVQHVAVEVEDRSVRRPAQIHRQLRVPVSVAAQDLQLLARYAGPIGADAAHVLSLVGMGCGPRRHDRRPVAQGRLRWPDTGLVATRVHVLDHGFLWQVDHHREGGVAIAGPGDPQAFLRRRRGCEHAGSSPAIRQHGRLGPAFVCQRGDKKAPVVGKPPSLAVANQQVQAILVVDRQPTVVVELPAVGRIDLLAALDRKLSSHAQLALAGVGRHLDAAQVIDRIARGDVDLVQSPLVLGPVDPPHFVAHPQPVLAVHC